MTCISHLKNKMSSTTLTKLKTQKTLEQHQKEYQGKHVNIVVDKQNYEDLKLLGEVPESFNDVIRKLLKEKQPIIKAIKEQKRLLRVSNS
jgi:hypothetical protein